MKRIDLTKERYDYDGVGHDKDWIEKWYLKSVNPDFPRKNSIAYRLEHLRKLSADEKLIRDDLLNDLEKILIANPRQLDCYRKSYGLRLSRLPVLANNSKKKRGKRPKTFKEKLLYAFGYNNARQTVLVRLASLLNVKTCPYCNLHRYSGR